MIRYRAVLISLILAGCAANPSAGSAVREPPAHGWATTQRVGEKFTDGFETLDVVDEPVQVVSVRFVGGEPGLKLIGYEIVPPGRKYATIQSMPGFPPRSADLSATRIGPDGWLQRDPSDQGYQLLLGIEVTQQGRWTRSAIAIEYRSNGLLYEQSLPAELTVCTPDSLDRAGECPFPA